MTSIVNLETERKNKKMFILTDRILESLNRIHDAKLSGALKDNELKEELIDEGKLFSNQVKKGLRLEEDVENFEKELPDGKHNYFSYPHKDIDVAVQTIKQTNTVALVNAESINKRTQMPEGYTKGLRKVG